MKKLLIVGAGFIAREHANAALDPAILSDALELHVADPNPLVLGTFLDQFPSAHTHDDAGAMFEAAGGNGVAIIATPPVSHAQLVFDALDAGLHVLCEKPLAMSTDEATRMSLHAEHAGLILDSCDSRFRDVPATRHVRDLVRSGSLGHPYHLTFVNTLRRARSGIDSLTESGWFRDPRVSGGGALMDWGPYDIAVLDEVLQPTRVEIHHAWASSPVTGGPFTAESRAVEQHVGAAMTVTMTDGTRVPVTYERAAATHGDERSVVQFEGESAATSWDWLDWTGGDVRLTSDEDGAPSTTVTHFDPPVIGFHGRPLARVLRAINDGADPSEITRTSVFTLAWLRAILDAAESGAPRSVERESLSASALS